jgi:choline dehydrogenase-like flavoprotein
MRVFRLSEIEADRDVETPICIIGAGVAGLLLACRLAHRGKRVLLLESGGMAFDGAIHALNTPEDRTGRYTRAMTGHYRAFGGSSTRWGGRMIPLSVHEVEDRPHLDLEGWPIAHRDLAIYGREIEAVMGLSPDSFEDDLLDAVDPAQAFPRQADDYACRWAKWPAFQRCNLAVALKASLEACTGVETWLEATVCGFELDSEAGRIAGVEARSINERRLRVTADHVIFAAGTIETTRLLLWIDALSKGRAFARTQVLGRYFQDHLNVEVGAILRNDAEGTNRLFGYHFVGATRRSLHLELSAEAQRADRVASAFAYVAMDLGGSALGAVKKVARGLQRGELDMTRAEAWDLLRNLGLVGRSLAWRYGRRQLFVPADVGFHMELCVEQLPQWDNCITLSEECDVLGLPKARLDWRPTEADDRTLRSAARRLMAYWRRSGFDNLCPMAWSATARDPAASFAAHAIDYAHPSGTARMGLDPRQAIVGSDLRCHHISNVSVVGAATFPTAGSANPTMTIMQMALYAGDRLH